MQTEQISFRASPVVAGKLASKARQEGVSISELLRGMIRKDVVSGASDD